MNLKHLRLALGALLAAAASLQAQAKIDDATYAAVVASRPQIGDVVFIRMGGPLFATVASTTGSWTSHVGIIVARGKDDWIVAECGIPFVRMTPLRRFLNRSSEGRFSLRRLTPEPTPEQKAAMLRCANAQLGRPYSLGFDLEGRGTFCSKFVHDVVYESTHMNLGQVETFQHLLHSNPNAPLTFWKAWFLGSIPWERTTLTPASELSSPLLRVVVENNV